MSRLAVLTVLIVGIGCAAPAPSPALLEPPTDAPTPSPLQVPTLALDVWHPACGDVPEPDCLGVAALFAHNLARNRAWVLEQSGGVIAVSARPECPPMPDWAVPGSCWQAIARVSDGTVCTIVARLRPDLPGRDPIGFGQVGVDTLSGLTVTPAGWPPCV